MNLGRAGVSGAAVVGGFVGFCDSVNRECCGFDGFRGFVICEARKGSLGEPSEGFCIREARPFSFPLFPRPCPSLELRSIEGVTNETKCRVADCHRGSTLIGILVAGIRRQAFGLLRAGWLGWAISWGLRGLGRCRGRGVVV